MRLTVYRNTQKANKRSTSSYDTLSQVLTSLDRIFLISLGDNQKVYHPGREVCDYVTVPLLDAHGVAVPIAGSRHAPGEDDHWLTAGMDTTVSYCTQYLQ